VLLRDDLAWEASLRNAGNPGEDFLVAEAGGVVAAYARATVLYGQRVILEAGALPAALDALADLVAALAGPRAVAADTGFAPGLAEALAARGVVEARVSDPTFLLRCLDAGTLARRLALPPPAPDEPEADFLRRVLPPERVHFWPADRF
jgi:hypothetical protein